jgi:hypothetical protein
MRDTHSTNGSSNLNNDTFMYVFHILQQTAREHGLTTISAHTHMHVSSLVRDGTLELPSDAKCKRFYRIFNYTGL